MDHLEAVIPLKSSFVVCFPQTKTKTRWTNWLKDIEDNVLSMNYPVIPDGRQNRKVHLNIEKEGSTLEPTSMRSSPSTPQLEEAVI